MLHVAAVNSVTQRCEMRTIFRIPTLVLLMSTGCASAQGVRALTDEFDDKLPTEVASLCLDPEEVIAGELQCVLRDQGLRSYAFPPQRSSPPELW